MSLSTNIYDLVIRAATEDKRLRTLINGNAPDLTALSTTDKTNLVAALNELYAMLATAAGINDGATGTGTTWSSQKITNEVAAARAGAVADAVDDGAPDTDTAWSSAKTDSEIGSRVAALLDDENTATGTTWSSSEIAAYVVARLDELIGGAPGTGDTLGELNNLLEQSEDAITALTTALGNRVRWDAAQSLSAGQMLQARTNIGAVSSADVGPTDTNFVAAYEAALA